MDANKPVTYRDAGVDTEAAQHAVRRYAESAKTTFGPEVLEGIGSFAGFFHLRGYRDPVLVAGTDGVGTKLEIAFAMDRYEAAGVDCVAMCVNDILCHGARPLFFLDYLACGKLEPEKAARLVEGVAAGCREAGCALIGGETAEMPGFYPPGVYDIAGFAVGVVERDRVLDGKAVREGDALVGLASSGLHSNGFSLVRKLIPDWEAAFEGRPIGEVLTEPTRIYVRPVLEVLEERPGVIHGMAHITGGGFPENIPRMFKDDLTAVIEEGSWPVPPIFCHLESLGVAHEEMFRTFNMGIGFVLAVAPGEAETIVETFVAKGVPAWRIGRVRKGAKGVCFE